MTTAQSSAYQPSVGSLCSGYGGLDMGLALGLGTTVRHAWHVEYDKHPSAILAHRFPGVPNYGDVKTTDWSQVQPVDWLTAGYPCQPFSGNGRRGGADDPRHLWPGVLRAIRALRPRHVLLENVEDHLTLGFGAVLADLAEAGFDAEWCVLRASDVGAPHGRPRLFVLATDTRRVLHAAAEPGRLAQSLRAEPAPAGSERLAGAGAGDDEDQDCADARGVEPAWGEYGAAVRRWERVLGRPAPAALVERHGDGDVNPAFVEWAMGLPAGWVTDVPGIPVASQLKALGNGVVPQQAALALRVLSATAEAVAA
jgi:DNA (cytosine-5)-methyltransferase 1